MKTLTKVLSMLIVVVLCMSCFGASAYAVGVPVGPSGAIMPENTGVAVNPGNGGVEVGNPGDEFGGSDSTPKAEDTLPEGGAGAPVYSPENDGVKKVATAAELDDALKDNEVNTIVLTADITVNTPATYELNRTVTINLGGHTFRHQSNVIITKGNLILEGTGSLGDVDFDAYPGASVTNKVTAKASVPSMTGDGDNSKLMIEDVPTLASPPTSPEMFTVDKEKYTQGDATGVTVTMINITRKITGFYCVRDYNGGNITSNLLIGAPKIDSDAIGSSTGTYVKLQPSYLDTLPAGNYSMFYLWCNASNQWEAVPMEGASFTIVSDNKISGPSSIKGGVEVYPRYTNEWFQGDAVLQFVVKPHSTDLRVIVDGKTVNVLDWYDYGDGYFYLGKAFLESLTSGTHHLEVTNNAGAAECWFYIGPNLRARNTNKHVTGSAQNLAFVCSDPISRVWVGNKELDNYDTYDYFYLSPDGKTITLTAQFLNNRTAGSTYTLTVQTMSGERVSTTFQILTTAQASASPKTGDTSNIALWSCVMVLSGAAAIVAVPRLKKKAIEE